MGGSYRAELMKLIKRPAMWILAGVLFTLSQVFGYLIPYVAYRGGGGSGFAAGETTAQLLADILPARLVPNTLGGFPMFAGAIALIVGALVTASEYGWHTLKTILTQRARRLSVMIGKLGVIATALLVLVVAVFAANAFWSWVVAVVEGRPAVWPSALDLAQGIGAGWLVLTTWGFVGAVLGVAFRSTSLAVGLGLVWALAIETVIRGFAGVLGSLDALQRGLPGTNAGSLVASLGAPTLDQPGGTPGVTAVVTGTHAVVVLTTYLAGLALVAFLALQRQDVR